MIWNVFKLKPGGQTSQSFHYPNSWDELDHANLNAVQWEIWVFRETTLSNDELLTVKMCIEMWLN